MPDFRDKIIYHSRLANILGNGEQHLSENELTSLTSGGNSTQHYHAVDRDRANHTGTQTASTISDFDTEVSNNTIVSDNTVKLSTIEENADVTDAENVGAAIDGSPEDAAPADTDQFAQTDSAGVLAWTSWSTIKSLIQTLTDSLYAPISNGVTNGNDHDHNGGDGAQIDHTTLSNIGDKSHATLDSEVDANTAARHDPVTISGQSYLSLAGQNITAGLVDVTQHISGIVPSGNLPSVVYSVLEYGSSALFPVTGESDKIYIAADVSWSYFWDGAQYVQIQGTSARWGQITGLLEDQTDLQSALDGKEDAFTKNTAFNKDFGTTSGTVCEGDDSRLNNQITTITSPGDPHAFDLSGAAVQIFTTTGARTFNTTGRSETEQKLIEVRFKPVGSGITPTWNSSWLWAGQAPTTIADGETGVLVLDCAGSTESDVIATYEVIGDGS